MVDWNSGAIFAVIWIAIFPLLGTISTIWFWIRRDVQPIKARSPLLVVLTDIVLILYMIVLCLQRIFRDEYPCWLNVWSGYVGTVVLLNTYIWRCWTLYFKFRLTQQRLLQKGLQNLPWFIRKKQFSSGVFLAKLSAVTTVFLTLPCGMLTAVDSAIVSQTGDNCDKKWLDPLLAGYVVVYATLLSALAVALRSVADGFKIKEELRFTGIVGMLAVIPWIIFNTSLKEFNKDVFPVSTLCLLVAVVAALSASTAWPLYRSIYEPPVIDTRDIPQNYNTFVGLLSIPQGVESFKKFLTKEFSVENLLFFLEVEELRKLMKELIGDPEADTKLIARTTDIYAKYVENDAPFQVNLPDSIVRKLNNDYQVCNYRYKTLKMSGLGLVGGKPKLSQIFIDIQNESRPQKGGDKDKLLGSGDTSTTPSTPQSQGDEKKGDGDSKVDGKDKIQEDFSTLRADFPTIFDDAQRNIFKLMKSDSFPRYIRTELYKEFVDAMSGKVHTTKVLKDMNLV